MGRRARDRVPSPQRSTARSHAPQQGRDDAQRPVPGGRGSPLRAGSARRDPGRGNRRPGRRWAGTLPAAAISPPGSEWTRARPGAGHRLLRLRYPVLRWPPDARPAAHRPPSAVRRGAPSQRGDPHVGGRGRARGGVLSSCARTGRGGHHGQTPRRALPARRAGEELAQDQSHAADGGRGWRIHPRPGGAGEHLRRGAAWGVRWGGRLQYIGHCGGGFTDAELRRLMPLLQARLETACPFAQVPPSNEAVTWVRPELVVEVEYAGWKNDGLLWVPVYKGRRMDKPARDVRREVPDRAIIAPAPAPQPPRPRPERRESADQLPGAPAGVELTNLEKIFWPQRGYTKGDLIRYYLEVGPHILPHLRDRPVTLRRFPNGITGESFYQKDYPDAPPFVETVRIWTESEKKTLVAPLCNTPDTLAWLAQLANIEVHTWFSRATPIRRAERAGTAGTAFAASEQALRDSTLNRPDYVVFDIDPYLFPDDKLPQRKGEKDPDYSRRGFDAAVEAALLLRDVLKRLKLDGFVKTSGKTGLHLFVPIVRRYTFEQTHAFAKTVTPFLEGLHPGKVTTAWAAEQRVGKVFLDYNQNRLGATLASAYSVRPTPEATVSLSLTWKELGHKVDPLEFNLTTVPVLMRTRKDAWRELLAKPQLLERRL